MVDVLTSEGVELRHESMIQETHLHELCDALWFERDLPARPQRPSDVEKLAMIKAAHLVQDHWIHRAYSRRLAKEAGHVEAHHERMDLHEGMEGNEHHECGLSAAELMYMTTAQETLIGGVTHTADAHHDDLMLNIALANSVRDMHGKGLGASGAHVGGAFGAVVGAAGAASLAAGAGAGAAGAGVGAGALTVQTEHLSAGKGLPSPLPQWTRTPHIWPRRPH
mmetsp:Transcript_2008/g.4674  ORF Transcript_2008/g.4674 Transcript_2008/m.4674 type:complete len:223 (+) Transcript_2008:297-965(+)